MPKPPATRLHAALGEICVKYGYCDVLREAVLEIDPRVQDTADITDIILRVEGIENPEYYDAKMRRNFAAILDDWLFDLHGRGANSQLPLTEAGA